MAYNPETDNALVELCCLRKKAMVALEAATDGCWPQERDSQVHILNSIAHDYLSEMSTAMDAIDLQHTTRQTNDIN